MDSPPPPSPSSASRTSTRSASSAKMPSPSTSPSTPRSSSPSSASPSPNRPSSASNASTKAFAPPSSMRPSLATANPSWKSATHSSTGITKSPWPRTATTSSPKASTASSNTPPVALLSSCAIRPSPSVCTAAPSRNSNASNASATTYQTNPFWRPNPNQTKPLAPLPRRSRRPPGTSPDNPRASAPTANPSSSP